MSTKGPRSGASEKMYGVFSECFSRGFVLDCSYRQPRWKPACLLPGHGRWKAACTDTRIQWSDQSKANIDVLMYYSFRSVIKRAFKEIYHWGQHRVLITSWRILSSFYTLKSCWNNAFHLQVLKFDLRCRVLLAAQSFPSKLKFESSSLESITYFNFV